ncbi:MAG: VTT domain-containing protein [Gammaproteobacteria bacterium]|nr:VTT domain-containing protein [Gammaproteobacteria bacterium]
MNSGNPAGRGLARFADRLIAWARLPQAPALLCAVSFAESIFFPIAVDVMLVPMCAAAPRRMARLAALTTAFSMLGGLAGLMLGYLAIDALMPWIESLGWEDEYAEVESWYQQWGYWALVLAAFTPLPYKVFAISAGGLGMEIGAFLAASLVGRGLRFFLVGGLAAWLGPKVLRSIRYSDRLVWALAGLTLAVFALWWCL